MAVKRYDGSAWQTVAGLGAQGPAATSSSIATWVKTASGGETSVSGNDDNSQPLSYTVGQELVFINGVLQKRGDDYTATTGNSITGLTALTAGDIVSVWTVNAFSVSNAISNTLVDAKGDLIVATGADTPGRLAVGTDGQVLTAASTTGTGLAWTTLATGTTFVGVSATKNAAQSINNATDTIVTFPTESYDTDGFHSTSTNTSRITIPSGKAGYYNFTGVLHFADNTTGIRTMELLKNGTSLGTVTRGPNPAAGLDFYMPFAFVASAAVNDYFEMRVYQNSGGALNCQTGTIFQASYLGA
jgi:hypothetical protein